jgi:hypothetical protein
MQASKVTSNGQVGNYYNWHQHPPILKKGFKFEHLSILKKHVNSIYTIV